MNIFSANVKNIKNFKQVLSILKDVHIDVQMIVTKNGICITSYDNAKSILVHVNMISDNFIDYSCLVEKFIITTSSQSLYKIVNKISNKSTLNICVKDHDYVDNTCLFLTLMVDNSIIKLKLNENCDEINIELKETTHKTTFLMKGEDILHVIKHMENISDQIELHVKINEVKFYCSGQYAESNISFPNHILSTQCDKIIIPTYFIKLISKSIIYSEPIQISFAHGRPLCLSYKIQDSAFIQFYHKNAESI